jgi:hypothetical protein
LSAVAGNGTRRWAIEKDDGFVADQTNLESTYPRVGGVFRAAERLFASMPTFNARQLAGGETWLYRTRAGFGAPALYIWYEIHDDENVVRLLAAHLAE